MCIEQVLQAEVAAVIEVVPAELLHQLQVVQTVSQRHGLLQANVCSTGGGGQTHEGRGNRKTTTDKT